VRLRPLRLCVNVETPELSTRCYIGHCPDDELDPEVSSLRVKLVEKLPGQFAGIPYEPFRVNCWHGEHKDGHLLYPCAPEECEAEDD
jgi:hypothetical protein